MTFVELIVVVTILGVLSIMALPAYTEMKLLTQNAKAITEIREIEKVVIAYSIDRGGVYPADLNTIGWGSNKDPWGTPYQYSVVPHRTFIVTINGDFDLYSKGRDTQSVDDIDDALSLDDLVRSGEGGFVGLADDLVP